MLPPSAPSNTNNNISTSLRGKLYEVIDHALSWKMAVLGVAIEFEQATREYRYKSGHGSRTLREMWFLKARFEIDGTFFF